MNEWQIHAREENVWGQVAEIGNQYYKLLYLPFLCLEHTECFAFWDLPDSP